MSSLQFDFLDFSEIEDNDYQFLLSILEEEKEEVVLPPLEDSSVKDLNEEEGGALEKIEALDFINQVVKDDNASGISFFVDGGTAEDIDPRDTPPILSSSVTPPHSDSPSTICNDQEEIIPEEEQVNLYPQAPPQTPYLNQPSPIVQTLNVHNVPTSGPVYNMPPVYPAHSGPGGVPSPVYAHMPPPHNHSHQIVPPTVHIENCHVNVSPYSNPHPPPHGALYATPPPPPPPPQYQGAPQHSQMFSHYMLTEQPSMPMQMKSLEKEYDHKRLDSHNRGNFRGRGRGRGRRRGREDHERSNSVSSDHSSYSDSGSKPHYKDNNGHGGPPLQPNQYSQIMQYYMPVTVTTMPRAPGFPMIPQFISPYAGDQAHHVMAYQAQPPPATVSLVPNENSSSQQPLIFSPSTIHESQQLVTTQPEYVISANFDETNTLDTTTNCVYPCIEECNSSIDTVTPNSVNSIIEFAANNSSNVIASCPSNTFVVKDDIEKNSAKNEQPIQYIENKVSNIKIDTEDNLSPSLNSSKTMSQDKIIDDVKDNNATISEAQEDIENNAQNVSQSTKNSRNKNKSANTKNVEKKLQPKTQNNLKSKVLEQAPVPMDFSTNFSEGKTVPQSTAQEKIKENGVPSKTKSKNSSNNIFSKSKTTDPLLIESVSDLSFGLDSITVYNQTLAPILKTNEFSSSKSLKVEGKKLTTNNVTDEVIISPTAEVASKPESQMLPEDGKHEQIATSTKSPSKGVIFKEISKPKSVVELPPENCSPTKPVEPAWGQKKVWSQLFKPNEDFGTKQIAFVSPFNAKENENASTKIASQKDTVELNVSNNEIDKVKIGTLLKKYIPDYRPVLLQPKGLINKNYWCYVNAPLQALLSSPSFYKLAKTLSKEAGYKSGNFSTPFINSIVDFVAEFNPMAPLVKQNRKDKNNKKEPEIVAGVPFEPTCVYKTLCNLKKDQFTEGRQQDAEEMLSCVLNGLHDEMVEGLKLAGGLGDSQNGTADQDLKSDDESEWKVQGPKKKSYVTRTAHFNPSPISQIFWGQLRCVLQHTGGHTTANLQPFNTLPLDIQSPKVDTLKDALNQLVIREEISGFTCPRTNQEVTASNQVMFEDLPRVLILQLKRFIYDNGGLQKVTKRLQFPIDLEITKDLLSTNSRGRFSASQRKYKLFAIVNHEGKEANKGHYVADVYHNGYNCWLRYDDSNVKAIPEAVVLRHDPPRVPYLLFYRRSDTLSPPSNQQVNGSSGGSNSSSSNSSISSNCNGKN